MENPSRIDKVKFPHDTISKVVNLQLNALPETITSSGVIDRTTMENPWRIDKFPHDTISKVANLHALTTRCVVIDRTTVENPWTKIRVPHKRKRCARVLFDSPDRS